MPWPKGQPRSAETRAKMSKIMLGNTNKPRIHGGSRTAEYQSWAAMRYRCLNPSHKSFASYGGRGISICDEWVDDFAQFLADMGERPPGTTLDRIDSDGDYEPSNCRWADWATQNNNKREKISA